MSQTQEKRWLRRKSYRRHLVRPKTGVVPFQTQKTPAQRFSYPNEAVFLVRRQQVSTMIRLAVQRNQQVRFIKQLVLAGVLLTFTYLLFQYSRPPSEVSGATQTFGQSPLPSAIRGLPEQMTEPELRAKLHSDQPVYVKLKAIGLAIESGEALCFELLAQTARNDRALPVRLKAVRELSKLDQDEGLTPFFISMIQGNDNVQIRLISLDWLLANRKVTQDQAQMDVIRSCLDAPLYARFVKQEVS